MSGEENENIATWQTIIFFLIAHFDYRWSHMKSALNWNRLEIQLEHELHSLRKSQKFEVHISFKFHVHSKSAQIESLKNIQFQF